MDTTRQYSAAETERMMKLQDVLLKAMAKKIEDRYATMAELAGALAARLRAMRETPIAMPIGIAVTQASRNALKTRNIDQPKCVASGASVSWPRADSHSRVNTVSGVGRNSGGSHR